MSNLVYTGYTWEGKDAATWYGKMIYGASSLKRMGIMPNVKSKMQVPNLDATEVSKAKNCVFTPGGEITIGTREIEVTTIDINLEWCEQDLESLFVSESMAPGSNSDGNWTPQQLNNMILERIALTANKEVENMIWRGDTAGPPGSYLSLIDGLEKKLGADGSVIQVAGVPLTAANVLTELAKIIDVIPEDMLESLNEPNTGIGVGMRTYRMIIAALAAITFNPTIITTVPDSIEYQGVKIFQFNGMSSDVMSFADFSRIWIGTDLVSDITDLRVLPQGNTSGDRTVRVVGRYKLGVEYAVSEEIVFYS